jgi:excisionase family DNA binding protein
MTIASVRPGRNAAQSDSEDGRLLTLREAAAYLGVSTRWLQSATAAGLIKRVSLALPGRTRGPVRYRKSDLDAFIESRQGGR